MSLKKYSLPILLLTTFIYGCNSSSSKSSKATGGNSNNETPVAGAEDPLASYAWHLENTGQTSFASNAGTAGQDQDIKEAQTAGARGAGVRIAVSDSGVDINHDDLSGNQLTGEHRNYSTDTSSQWHGGSPYPTEREAHGTAVTGLIAALGWNGIGSRGVAPSAHYAGFLFIGNFHTSQSSYEAKTLDQMDGTFDIFNYSYGYDGCEFIPVDDDVMTAYKYGVTSLRSGKGAVYVQAAGNEYIGSNSYCYTGDNSAFLGNTNTSEDHNHPYVILAGAVNAKGKITSYSTPGSGVWVTAAGGEDGADNPAMLTTDILSCTYGFSSSSSSVTGFNKGTNSLNSKCNYTNVMNGTSSATPVLVGIVALMLEANPNLSWRDVKHILASTSDKINYSTAAYSHPNTANSLASHTYDYLYVRNAAGYDFSNKYGFGRANAKKALDAAKAYSTNLGTYVETVNTSTGDFLYSSGTVNLTIPDKSATGVTNSITVSQNLSIESVQIKLTTDHQYIGDLGVELTSPSGTRSKILLINSNIKDAGLSDFTMLSNAFYGETSSGSWTIKLIDGATNDTGRLVSWKLKINGHTP